MLLSITSKFRRIALYRVLCLLQAIILRLLVLAVVPLATLAGFVSQATSNAGRILPSDLTPISGALVLLIATPFK